VVLPNTELDKKKKKKKTTTTSKCMLTPMAMDFDGFCCQITNWEV
jgi:hypothetical protein